MSALRGIIKAHIARLGFGTLAVAAVLACVSGPASAAQGWEITSVSNTTVRAGDELTYAIEAINRTEADSDGTPITLTLTLPTGFTGVRFEDVFAGWDCGSVAGLSVITCTANVGGPDARMRLLVTVAVDSTATGVKTADVEVSGGGLTSAATADPVTISPVPPPFGIDAFDGQVDDSTGAAYTQAGGHPASLSTALDFNTATDTSPTSNPFQPIIGPNEPIEPVKDIVVDLPPGLVGNPSAVDECTSGELANSEGITPRPLCPPTSQVGTAEVIQNGTRLIGAVVGPYPIFNMVPPPGVPARFGINVLGTIVVLDASVRTGADYGLTVTSRNVSAGVSLIGAHLDFWGVPADASHDAERSCSGQKSPGDSSGGDPPCTSGAGSRAFFRLPTSCTAPGVGLTTTVRVDSWFHPGDFKTASFESHVSPGYPFASNDPSTPWGVPIGPNGCDRVPFDPEIDAQLVRDSRAAATAALSVDISIPQTDDPSTTSQSDLRKAVVTLPAGMHVNAASANGLGACTSEQIALRSDAAPTCPDASKIGTVTIDTPLLDVPVTGGIYLAKPFDNPFDSLIAIYVVASAKGVVIKLPGQISMDANGQITSTFDNNPQLPFSRLHLEFKSGPLASLAVPNRCGVYTTHAEFTGWNGRSVSRDSSFELPVNGSGKPCPPQFSPGFSAGTKSNSAGSFSSFLLRFTRSDEDQELRALTVSLPRGISAKFANADLCTDAQVGADACPANSKIGDVATGAGTGSIPFFITNGRAYLTGPYKGAPFGVAIVVPAVAGPFDLGKVTVRSALFVDKHDATGRIVSDPLPRVLQGIPLDIRDVRVNVNKPSFFLNPTSCAVKKITGTITSTEGASANVSDRFQAADCASLGFKPRMVMRVGGRGHTRRGKTSPFTTTLTMPSKDQANLRLVRVTLPDTINARLNTINDACTRAEFEGDVKKCAHAVAGSATASTPLLRRSLSGSVYFVKNGHAIPDLFVALRGQVSFDLVGRISIVNNRLLRTTFDAAPDVPIRSFTLRLLGGPSTASIGAATNLCSKESRSAKVAVDYIGQNGTVRQVQQALNVAGCGKQKAHRRSGHKR